jgi:hypothetical protein
MAKITLFPQGRAYTSVAPYGNTTTQRFTLTTNAAGKPLNSNATAALANGDVVDLGPLQEGLRLDDAQIIVTNVLAGNAKLGFLYEDGVDDPGVPQSDTYFFASANLAAAARLRATGAKLVTLPKPARLVLTMGAAAAVAGNVEVLVSGEHIGPQ